MNTTKHYSPIAPIELLWDLYHEGKLGFYHLLLAHDVLENGDSYQELFNVLRRDLDIVNTHVNHSNVFIILDNSTVELGAPLPTKDLARAAEIIQPSCLILPDAIGDSLKTLRLAWKFFNDYSSTNPWLSLMGVPQGSTRAELIMCARHLRQIPAIKFWGIPRLVSNNLGTREILARELKYGPYYDPTSKFKPNVHMLGMSHNYEDDIRCTRMPGVMGIDSANPLVQGQKKIKIKDKEYKHTERGDYWKKAKKATIETLDNISLIRTEINVL